MKNERIVVFGASGGTGRLVVEQALERGHRVHAFVRDERKLGIAHTRLSVQQGDVLRASDVATAIGEHDMVLCCLGMPASDRSALRAIGTGHIVRAMEQNGARRLICQTSLGFGDSIEVLPWHMKYFIVPFILKHAFIDHARQEEIIAASSLDWTIVRPGNMTNGKLTGNYKSAFAASERIRLKVSRADVAHFLLEQVGHALHLRRKVGISY